MKPELKSAISVVIFTTSILNLIIYFILSNLLERTPNVIFILFISLVISIGLGWRYYLKKINSP